MSSGGIRALAWIRDELERLTRKQSEFLRNTGKDAVCSIEQGVDEFLHVPRCGGHMIDKAGEELRTPEHPGAPPIEDIPPLPRLIDRSVPGEEYSVQDPTNPGLYAYGVISSDGELALDIRTTLDDGQRSPLLRGAEQFHAILKFFEGEFTSIIGKWQWGSNLARFNELTARGVSPEIAAARTWTGEQAGKAGFRTIKVLSSEGDPGNYTDVQVEFTR